MPQRFFLVASAIVFLAAATLARAAGLPPGAVEFPPASSQADREALALAETGNGAALRAYADRWVKAAPNSANAWFYHGLGAELSGTKAWAVDDYRRALQLQPGQGASAYGLGRALFSMDKDTDALEPLRLASLAYPNNNRVWADYGLVLGDMGRIQEAASALQRSVNLDPSNLYHAGELADAYAALKDYARAIPLYQKASRKVPFDEANVTWLGNLGQALGLAGDYRQSVQVLQQTLRYTPNDPDIWSGLWVAYLKLGDTADAARAKATVQRLTTPRPSQGGGSNFGAIVTSIARQNHENYLHNTGQLNLNEHLP